MQRFENQKITKASLIGCLIGSSAVLNNENLALANFRPVQGPAIVAKELPPWMSPTASQIYYPKAFGKNFDPDLLDTQLKALSQHIKSQPGIGCQLQSIVDTAKALGFDPLNPRSFNPVKEGVLLDAIEPEFEKYKQFIYENRTGRHDPNVTDAKDGLQVASAVLALRALFMKDPTAVAQLSKLSASLGLGSAIMPQAGVDQDLIRQMRETCPAEAFTDDDANVLALDWLLFANGEYFQSQSFSPFKRYFDEKIRPEIPVHPGQTAQEVKQILYEQSINAINKLNIPGDDKKSEQEQIKNKVAACVAQRHEIEKSKDEVKKLKQDPEKNQKAIEAKLRQIETQIKDAVKNEKQIATELKNLNETLKKDLEKKSKSKNTLNPEEFKLILQGYKDIGYAGAQLMALSDPEMGRFFANMVNVAVATAMLVGAQTGAATFGAAGALVGAVVGTIVSFFDNHDNSAFLKELENINYKLTVLRQELRQYHNINMYAHYLTHQALEQLSVEVQAARRSLSGLRKDVVNLSIQVAQVREEIQEGEVKKDQNYLNDFREQLKRLKTVSDPEEAREIKIKLIDYAIGSKATFADNFNPDLKSLNTYLKNASSGELLILMHKCAQVLWRYDTGVSFSPKVSKEGPIYNPANQIIDPALYVTAVNNLLDSHLKYPDLFPLSEKEIADLINAGKKIVQAYAKLADPNLVKQGLKYYSDQLNLALIHLHQLLNDPAVRTALALDNGGYDLSYDTKQFDHSAKWIVDMKKGPTVSFDEEVWRENLVGRANVPEVLDKAGWPVGGQRRYSPIHDPENTDKEIKKGETKPGDYWIIEPEVDWLPMTKLEGPYSGQGIAGWAPYSPQFPQCIGSSPYNGIRQDVYIPSNITADGYNIELNPKLFDLKPRTREFFAWALLGPELPNETGVFQAAKFNISWCPILRSSRTYERVARTPFTVEDQGNHFQWHSRDFDVKGNFQYKVVAKISPQHKQQGADPEEEAHLDKVGLTITYGDTEEYLIKRIRCIDSVINGRVTSVLQDVSAHRVDEKEGGIPEVYSSIFNHGKVLFPSVQEMILSAMANLKSQVQGKEITVLWGENNANSRTINFDYNQISAIKLNFEGGKISEFIVTITDHSWLTSFIVDRQNFAQLYRKMEEDLAKKDLRSVWFEAGFTGIYQQDLIDKGGHLFDIAREKAQIRATAEICDKVFQDPYCDPSTPAHAQTQEILDRVTAAQQLILLTTDLSNLQLIKEDPLLSPLLNRLPSEASIRGVLAAAIYQNPTDSDPQFAYQKVLQEFADEAELLIGQIKAHLDSIEALRHKEGTTPFKIKLEGVEEMLRQLHALERAVSTLPKESKEDLQKNETYEPKDDQAQAETPLNTQPEEVFEIKPRAKMVDINPDLPLQQNILLQAYYYDPGIPLPYIVKEGDQNFLAFFSPVKQEIGLIPLSAKDLEGQGNLPLIEREVLEMKFSANEVAEEYLALARYVRQADPELIAKFFSMAKEISIRLKDQEIKDTQELIKKSIPIFQEMEREFSTVLADEEGAERLKILMEGIKSKVSEAFAGKQIGVYLQDYLNELYKQFEIGRNSEVDISKGKDGTDYNNEAMQTFLGKVFTKAQRSFDANLLFAREIFDDVIDNPEEIPKVMGQFRTSNGIPALRGLSFGDTDRLVEFYVGLLSEEYARRDSDARPYPLYRGPKQTD